MSRKSLEAGNEVDEIQDKNVISKETANDRQNSTELMESKLLILHDVHAKFKTAEREYEEVFKQVFFCNSTNLSNGQICPFDNVHSTKSNAGQNFM